MLAALLGDDVFGDDPRVNALQEKIAALLGFEVALFVPAGTQSNLCALLAHCYRWEGGGGAVFGSVQPQPLNHQSDGTLALADIEAAIKPDDAHFARTRLLALENILGGKLLPMDYVQERVTLALSKGLSRHLDGARLFNAATAQAAHLGSDVFAEAQRIAQCFDSMSVCFSKGLGAPMGSALCGSKAFIARARRVRKMAGGGQSCAGSPCAAFGPRPCACQATRRRLGQAGRPTSGAAANQYCVCRPAWCAARKVSCSTGSFCRPEHTGYWSVTFAFCHPHGCGCPWHRPHSSRHSPSCQQFVNHPD
jgi:Beta-eliminating lyase